MLLLGAGTGEGTCGLLYLAGYLRRHGVEAFVRLNDADETQEALTASLSAMLAHVRPRLVGISLKWFHHLARAHQLARTLKALDPALTVVLGGNTAAYYWKELLPWTCVDAVVLGDGEAPLLGLCRDDPSPPNVARRGDTHRPRLGYVQQPSSADVYYSHFDDIFLDRLDQHAYSGWIAPGKGCGENCVYCGGGRGVQEASFGRARAFLRDEASVWRDHRQVVPRSWQLRYDFSGGDASFLAHSWKELDLSCHSTTYFLWGVPSLDLVEALSARFRRAFLVIDVGCFSQTQRLELRRRGLLKPCPTDAELFRVLRACRRYPNVTVEVSGIAGLPLATCETLAEEETLVRELHAQGCAVGYQRLEAQPGALVTEHPERFGMHSEARTFTDFLAYFEKDPTASKGVPMVRFADPSLERAVRTTFERLKEQTQTSSTDWPLPSQNARLRTARASRLELTLGEWLGRHRVPASLLRAPVTVVRSSSGADLACAPSVPARNFAHPSLLQEGDAAAVLAMLDCFATPREVREAQAVAQLRAGLNERETNELIVELLRVGLLEATEPLAGGNRREPPPMR